MFYIDLTFKYANRKEGYGSNTTEVAYPSLISLLISTSMKPFRLFYLVAIATWIVQKYYIYAGLIGLAAVVEAGSSVFLQFRVTEFRLGNVNRFHIIYFK